MKFSGRNHQYVPLLQMITFILNIIDYIPVSKKINLVKIMTVKFNCTCVVVPIMGNLKIIFHISTYTAIFEIFQVVSNSF